MLHICSQVKKRQPEDLRANPLQKQLSKKLMLSHPALGTEPAKKKKKQKKRIAQVKKCVTYYLYVCNI
jgi:hypothetical protein